MSDAYKKILEAIDLGDFSPKDKMVESELAERFGISRTPIREAFQKLEAQGILVRNGRSLIIASLDHNQLGELYAVRSELEGLAARLSAQHAADEELVVLQEMIDRDRQLIHDPKMLARNNRVFHKHFHLSSHNRYLVQQLEMVHRNMALFENSSLAVDGRGDLALNEHQAIIDALQARDGQRAYEAAKHHISKAYKTRLNVNSIKM